MDCPGKDVCSETDARTNLHVPLTDLPAGRPEHLVRLREAWAQLPALPKLLASRDQGDDASFPGFGVRTLLRGEESSGRWSVHSIVLSPGAVLPAHIRHDADCYWLVVEGGLDTTVGARRSELHGPAFAFAPAGTVQAIANRSASPVEVLLGCSPAGADRAFDAAHRLWTDSVEDDPRAYLDLLSDHGFRFVTPAAGQDADAIDAVAPRVECEIACAADMAALRQRWSQMPPVPRMVADPSRCRNIEVEGQETRVLLTPEESGGRASVFMEGVEAGFGAPPHHQPNEDEFFFVLEGPLRLTIGDVTAEAAPRGAFAFAPRFATHAFTNATDAKLRMFSMNSPGGHDRGFELATRISRDSPGFGELIQAHGFQFHEAI